MDHNLGGGLVVVSHGSHVVTLGVPDNSFDDLVKHELDESDTSVVF